MGRFYRFLRLAAASAICCATGCSSESKFEFDALDLAPPQEELSEFSLGEYKIPIPVVEDGGQNQLTHRNRFQLDFTLYALIRPLEYPHVADAWSRNEGKVRDHVIRVCRNATLDELQEPEFATLKAKIMDTLATKMGGSQVRQLLITDVVSQKL